MDDDIYTPDEWAPSPIEGPHDHKGYSEEKCVRCGWVMGMTALNCQNNDTPHLFPSQQEPELVVFQSDIPDPFPDVDNPWNEIERLRAAIETYVVTVQNCYCTSEMERAALETLKEARRG